MGEGLIISHCVLDEPAPITMYNQGETEMSGIVLAEILVGWQATIKQVNK